MSIQAGWPLAAALALPVSVAAASPTELPPQEVTSPRLNLRWVETPTAITTVQPLPGDPGGALDEVLSQVPGVFAQNRYNLNQGLRLSIRGFGSRASFGVRGIRVTLDDLPLTMPDGQTELDALDLALLERVEVLRGGASSLYGNGGGGVLALTSRSLPEQRYGRVDVAGGELGERRLRAELGGSGERYSGLFSVAHRELDTHRVNMGAESLIGSGRFIARLGPGTLSASLNTLDIDADDAGALTRAEADADPGGANPAAVRFAVGESIQQERFGLTWLAPLSDDSEYRLRGWVGQRDFDNRLPFANGGQTVFERRFAGLGAQVDHRAGWGGWVHRISAGVDFETQTDDRSRYNNAEGGIRGDQTLSQEEKARGVGVFITNQMALGGPWLASLGARYDAVKLSVRDDFLADGDDSGERSFDKSSFSLGLGHALGEHSLLFVRFGTGFESPTNNELANPDGGGFNPAVDTTEARNVEVGIKHDRPGLRAELVLYAIRNDGELVRYELPGQSGRSYFRNAGASDRRGVEAHVAWQAVEPLTLSLGYTFNDFSFRDYVLGDTDYSDHEIPGVPRQQLFAEAAVVPHPGWVARLQAVALDRVYADDANAVRVPGYVVANARLAWEGQRANVTLAPWLAVNNLFDIDYTDNLRTNATFGRYYDPAAGRAVVGGISVKF